MTTTGEHRLTFDVDFDLDRLRGFSDCVFAVAITFVVATFRLPVDNSLDNERLSQFLANRWGVYVAFLAGFLVVGYYWLSHHRLFELLERADGRLVWLNFALLFFVVLMPYPTELLGVFRVLPDPYFVFNAVAFLLGIMNLAMWIHATGERCLVSSRLQPRSLLIYRLRAAWLPLVFAIAFAVTLTSSPPGVPWQVIACWALLPLGRPLIRWRLGEVPFAELEAEAGEVDDQDRGDLQDLAATSAEQARSPAGAASHGRPDLRTLQRMFRSSESMGRLISFSDNVYAFAITLLGTHFYVSKTERTHTTIDLRRAFDDITSTEFAAFALTFFVIAVFWLVHHRQFLVIERQNGTLRVLDLVHLMAIAVLPLSTDLLSTFDDDQLPFIVYAVTVFAASATLAVIFTYAATRRRLVDPLIPDHDIRRGIVVGWLTPTMFLLSIPAAFVSLWLAWFLWLVPLVSMRFVRARAL